MLRGAGETGWFGWPTDPELERLRNAWFDSADPAEQARIATAMQVQAFRSLPYIPLGSTIPHVAYNSSADRDVRGPGARLLEHRQATRTLTGFLTKGKMHR